MMVIESDCLVLYMPLWTLLTSLPSCAACIQKLIWASSIFSGVSLISFVLVIPVLSAEWRTPCIASTYNVHIQFNHLVLINKYDALLMKWCSVYHLWAPSSYCIDNAIYHISNILCIILAGWYCFREAECSVCSSSFRHCYDKFVSY